MAYDIVSFDGTQPVKVDPSTQADSSNVPQSNTSVTLLVANPSRLGATIANDGTSDLLVKLGVAASLTSFTARIEPGGYYELPFRYTGNIDGVWVASGTGAARISELT